MGQCKMNYQCIQPTYVRDFQCDAHICGQNCCEKNWGITIDETTYQKYKSMDESVIKELLNHIKWNDNLHKYVIEHQNGKCPVLGKDGFCRIQKQFGSEYLSDTCMLYPRIIRAVQGITVLVLSTTCPIAARLVLTNKHSMNFEVIEIKNGRGKVEYQIDDKSYNKDILQHFFVLQTRCISILQRRDLAINQRLFLLGAFLIDVNELIQCKNANQLPQLAEQYAENLPTANELPNSRQISTDYIKWMEKLISSLYANIDAYSESPRFYLNSIFQALPSFGEDGNAAITAVKYNLLLEQYTKRMTTFEYMLENYLVNDFFSHLYPFAYPGSILHNYYIFITLYRLLEFFLVCFATMNPDFGEKELISIISRFEHRTVHTEQYVSRVANITSSYESNNETFMNILLT